MEAEQIAKSKDWLRSVGRSVIFTSPTCEHAQSLERYIEELEQQLQAARAEAERLRAERLLLAKLSASEPQFYNPLEAMAAMTLRDQILDTQAAASRKVPE